MISGLALDIDDTLAHTTYDRFQQLTKTFGDCGMDFEQAMELNHGRTNTIWTSDEAQAWMMKKVHDNNYQTKIPLIAHALESVHELHVRNPFLYYITMRPQDVLSGTEERLQKHGFPILPIIARPLSIPKEKEHSRKVGILNELYQEGVTGIIDDQIKLIHQMEENFPDYPGVIHIVGPTQTLESTINHTISDSRLTLKERLL